MIEVVEDGARTVRRGRSVQTSTVLPTIAGLGVASTTVEPLLTIQVFFAITAFLWGSLWGSFLNVVIWRLPRGESLATPGSRCPSCETPIRWHDNVPILGWFVLRGRCRDCEAPIAGRYPFVEALVAVLSVLIWLHVASGRLVLLEDGMLDLELLKGVLVQFIFHFYFVVLLVAIAFIDLDLTLIPDRLTFPGIGWGLLGALLTHKGGVWAGYFPSVDVVTALVGALAGGGLIFLVFRGYAALRGIDGGGDGDIWMLAMIGANLGWQSIPVVLLLSSLQGIVVALLASLWDRRRGRRAGGEGSLLIAGAHTDAYWEGRIGGLPPHHASESGAASAGMAADSAEGPEPAADGASDDGFMMLSVPFGPFLALAAIEYLFVGRVLLNWATAGMYP